MHITFISVLIISCVKCESTTESVGTLLQTYSNYINSSLALDKSDRQLMKTWFTDFQVQQVNLTALYRLDMLRHKEQNFQWINVSSKWQECIILHRHEINNSQKDYYAVEGRCLNAANVHEGKERHSVYQVEKEIKKWRKTYRYLAKQCNTKHPGNEDGAGQCLVEYMNRDNYYKTFQRLILLKLECTSTLYSHMQTSLRDLQACLRANLSQYLSDVRTVMTSLNQCYNIKNKRS